MAGTMPPLSTHTALAMRMDQAVLVVWLDIQVAASLILTALAWQLVLQPMLAAY